MSQFFTPLSPTSSSSPVMNGDSNEYSSIDIHTLIPEIDGDPGLWRETCIHLIKHGEMESDFLLTTRRNSDLRQEIGLRSADSFYKIKQYENNFELYPQKSVLMSMLASVLDEVLAPLFQEWLHVSEQPVPQAQRKALSLYFRKAVHEAMLRNGLLTHPMKGLAENGLEFTGSASLLERLNIGRAREKCYRLWILAAEDMHLDLIDKSEGVNDALSWFKQRITSHPLIKSDYFNRMQHIQNQVKLIDDLELGIDVKHELLRRQLLNRGGVISGFHSFQYIIYDWLVNELQHSSNTTEQDFRAACLKIAEQVTSESIAAIIEQYSISGSHCKPRTRYMAQLSASNHHDFYLSLIWTDELKTALSTIRPHEALKNVSKFKKQVALLVVNTISEILSQIPLSEDEEKSPFFQPPKQLTCSSSSSSSSMRK